MKKEYVYYVPELDQLIIDMVKSLYCFYTDHTYELRTTILLGEL